MELDNIFADHSDDLKPLERRVRFTGEAKAFILKMEKEGFPISNLVNFIIKQATPGFEKKGYTYEGYDRMKQQIRGMY